MSKLVNVYGMPERRYEVRSEETALDVQVHGQSKYIEMVEKLPEPEFEKQIQEPEKIIKPKENISESPQLSDQIK